MRSLLSIALDRGGGVAMIAAIFVPVILVIGCGAVDLSAVRGDYSAMQDAADATALDAAKQLGIADNAGIAARASQFMTTQIPQVVKDDGVTAVTTFAADNSNLTVTLSGHRSSFFGSLLPPGGWSIHASATAASLGMMPLCVLSSGGGASDDIVMSGLAQVTAPGCLVQSNGNVSVQDSAALQAGAVQSVGSATGAISPAPQVGAPAIADPFASMQIKANGLLCNPLDLVFDLGVNVLSPGIHCGNLTVRKSAVVQLLPGEHYFINSHLNLMENSQLTGADVVLVFDDNSNFTFQDGSQISLQGRQGKSAYAGFVIATTRRNTQTFTISTSSAREILGTIYIPNATLAVSGANNRVADQSAWTVVVAKAITLAGSPNLVINANYAGSTVPVPGGVGPRSGRVTLTH
jgi:Putative Flp pilus-assembly TadE/G-like